MNENSLIIQKQATIASIKTLADRSIRVTIDLIDGDAQDMATLYKLQRVDSTVIIAPTTVINAQAESGEETH
jgi:hypothetical protein